MLPGIGMFLTGDGDATPTAIRFPTRCRMGTSAKAGGGGYQEQSRRRSLDQDTETDGSTEHSHHQRRWQENTKALATDDTLANDEVDSADDNVGDVVMATDPDPIRTTRLTYTLERDLMRLQVRHRGAGHRPDDEEGLTGPCWTTRPRPPTWSRSWPTDSFGRQRLHHGNYYRDH